VQALLLCVAVASDAPFLLRHWASAEGRAVAVETKETKMRVFSLPQLMVLTRTQLFALVAMLTEIIANPATSAEDRALACSTLHTIRLALSRKPPCP
jgi:hypothetical protein